MFHLANPLLLAALLLCDPAHARFHAALSSEGKLVVAEHALAGSAAFDPLRVVPAPAPPRRNAGNVSRAVELRHLVRQVSAESGIEMALLDAIIQQESAYDPMATSSAGAVGLMQLMPATARRFGVRDRRDPLQNLRAGAAYLAWLMRSFNNDLDLVLAAYNAGEGAVRRHGNRIPPYPETQDYVVRVRQGYGR